MWAAAQTTTMQGTMPSCCSSCCHLAPPAMWALCSTALVLHSCWEAAAVPDHTHAHAMLGYTAAAVPGVGS